MAYRIFISSVQREFAKERKAVCDLVSGNPQLARFFSTFAFEFDVPAADKRTDEVYLAELAVSDLYVAIIGDEYGGTTADGVSATESEYDEATRPLFYVKYIEEIGSGTVDMFDLCKATGLRPPTFDIDARHFTVTVYRPEFDEHGNRIPASGEKVGVKTPEVRVKVAEVSPKTQEVGPYPEQIGPKAITKAKKPITNNTEPITITHEPITICWCPENEKALSGSRKDLRERAKVIWEHLAENPDLTVRALSLMLRYSLAATQGAINALKECGLLVKIGQTRGSKWIVKTLASDTEVIG